MDFESHVEVAVIYGRVCDGHEPPYGLTGADRLDEPIVTTGRVGRVAGDLGVGDFREALGRPPSARVRSWLRQLQEEGTVVRHGGGRRGDPYVYGLREP